MGIRLTEQRFLFGNKKFKRNQEGYGAPAVNSFGCDYDEDDYLKQKSNGE